MKRLDRDEALAAAADAGGEYFCAQEGALVDTMRLAQEVADATGWPQIVHRHAQYGACINGLWNLEDENDHAGEKRCVVVRPRMKRHEAMRKTPMVRPS